MTKKAILSTFLSVLFASLSLACGLEPEPTPEPSRTPETSLTQAPSPEPVASPTPAPSPTVAPPPTPSPQPRPTPNASETRGTQTDEKPSAPAAPAPSSYLTATVEPCTPVEGSDIDPCERRYGYNTQPFFSTDGKYLRPPPTMVEAMGTIFNKISGTPHIAIRAVALPGTTRCVPAGFIGLYNAQNDARTEHKSFDCFADFEIRDYIVGRGPELLTIWITHGRDDDLSIDWSDDEYVANEIVAKAAADWEGYEWVLALTPFGFATTEAWWFKVSWQVQKLEDGTIAAVSETLPMYEWFVESGLMDERYISRIKPSLAVFEQDIRDAIATLNGRVAGEDPNRPLLVQDANAEFLHEFFVAQGVYDNPVLTPAPPPPVPGGEDPVGSGAPSNEGETSGEGSAPGDPTPAAGN